MSDADRWLTDDELVRALNSVGVPKNRKTVRQWPRQAPGISRLIANRRMFHPRLPEMLLAGHKLRDIGMILAAQEDAERFLTSNRHMGQPVPVTKWQ